MGQAPAGTRFVARTRGCAVQIEPRGATLHLAPAAQPHADESSRGPRPRLARRHAEPTRSGSGSVLRMALVDSAPQPAVSGSQQLPGHVNYLLGRDRSGWKTGVRTFAQVRCDQVYPGIDLAYYGNGSELEYDFIVGAGAEPANIRMRMSGAEELKVDAAGDLLIRTEAGTLRQQRPTAYQEAEGGRRTVQASYRVAGDTVAFELGDFDRSRALVIDPLLNYSTYLGGNGADAGNAAAADASGNAYLTGTTASLDFPTSAAAQGAKLGTTDAFVSKLNPAGNALIYSTYLGGAASESGLGIVVDVNDGATITGETTSANFPVTSGPAYGGNSDAFVTRLDGSGAPVFSTLVGGSDTDIGNGVAVDGSQNAYVVGTTSSSNLRGATPAAFGGESDAFVTKLNSAGVLQYTRFVGGNDFDAGFGIGVSPGGEAIIAGDTFSPNFPRVGALQNARNGEADGFVSRLNAGGSALQYSTYLGGSDYDRALAVAVDSDGNAYVTGTTYSSNFPTASAFQAALNGSSDAYLCKYNAAGNAFIFATLLGGNDLETGYAITLDTLRRAWVVGETFSSDLPVAGAVQAAFGGTVDAFATRFEANGQNVDFSSYLGGEEADAAFGVGVDPADNAYIVGTTSSTQFPLAAAAQTSLRGTTDAFVARIGSGPGTPLAPTNLRATATLTSISLAWNDNSDNELQFQLERRFGGLPFSLLSAQTSTTYLDQDVTQNVTYFYRVRAVNALGVSTYSNQLEVTVPSTLPAAPTALTATPVGPHRIDLHWTDNSDNEVIFQIERQIGTGEFDQLELVPADTTEYSDTTVNPGTSTPSYTYRVTAFNALGASAPATAGPVSVIAGAKGKVSPTKLKFGTVRLTKTKTKTFTIKNIGKVNLQGTVLAPVTPFQIVTGAGPFTLLPKKSLKVTVRMAPQEAESYTGTITVLSTDTAKPQVNVELSGLAK